LTCKNLNKREFDIFIGRNKMNIKACPKCGSRDIRMAGIGEGTIFGLTSWDMVCEKCNYKGMSILFDSENDYEAFLKELENEQKPD
jgi:C4-type Zn-finger protein